MKKYPYPKLEQFAIAWANACIVGQTVEARRAIYARNVVQWFRPKPRTAKRAQFEIDCVTRILNDNSLFNCGEAG